MVKLSAGIIIVKLIYNDVSMFSIESVQKIKVPSGLYWPLQSYYHVCSRDIFQVSDIIFQIFQVSIFFHFNFSSSTIKDEEALYQKFEKSWTYIYIYI